MGVTSPEGGVCSELVTPAAAVLGASSSDA